MKIVIVGGVAGGATAAARLRGFSEDAEIIILERSGFVSYANCGLPYYIGGEIKSRSALTLQTPGGFKQRFNIDVRVKNEAIAIDRANKTVRVRNLNDGSEYTENYDKLILSPGAKAIVPDIDGIASDKIFTLRTVENTFEIDDYIKKNSPETAVVIGGGFIGLEMAENLTRRGIKVKLIQRTESVMPNLDYDMACMLHAELLNNGVELMLSKNVIGFGNIRDKLEVRIEEEAPIETEFAILAVGVVPESHLAEEAGLELGIKKAIKVNSHMKTSDPDIYAVGDAVEVKHFVTGGAAHIALAGPANKQGRIAADHIMGRDSQFNGSQGSSVIKVFELTAASTGINESQAEAAGLKYDRVVISSASHATYYPGAEEMVSKLIFETDTGRILGAQIVGYSGVDKRIDVIATAIRAKMTASDLEELELVYAPPYSSAKDPVNMLGFVAENVRSGLVKQHHWFDMDKIYKDENAVLLDVRTVGEFDRGRFKGAVNIPLDGLRDRLGELDKEKFIYVNCQSGLRSYIACRILSENGFKCSNFSGGYKFYENVLKNGAPEKDAPYPCGLHLK